MAGGCFRPTFCASQALITISSLPVPTEETRLSFTASMRSFQLCGSILKTSGWFEFLPLPARLPVLPSQLLSSADSPVHFTARDDLRVIPKRKENEREKTHASAHSAQAEPNLPRILLSHSASLVLLSQLNYTRNCDWFREISGYQPYIWCVSSLFLKIYFLRNAAFSVHHQFSLPSYFNLYLWNWVTPSESIPFLINQLSVDLYSGQRVKLSNIFCFNVLNRAEIGPWLWLSRHPSSSRRATQMNCPETELTKSYIFLSAVLISVLGFYVNFQISLAVPAPNRKGINSLVVKDVGTPDAWAFKISIQHVAAGMWACYKANFGKDVISVLLLG